MAYQLTITREDISALRFVGGRYFCGTDLLNLLLDCDLEYADPDYDDPDWEIGFTATLAEHQAWEIAEMMDQDTEDMTTNHPMLGGDLWSKLVDLHDSIV